jgi:hypothetical protein
LPASEGMQRTAAAASPLYLPDLRAHSMRQRPGRAHAEVTPSLSPRP